MVINRQVGQVTQGQLQIAAPFLRFPEDLDLFGLLGRKGQVRGRVYLKSIDGRIHAPQANPHLFIFAFRVIGQVHTEDLRSLPVRQTEQCLYLVEPLQIAALVEQNPTVTICTGDEMRSSTSCVTEMNSPEYLRTVFTRYLR